MLANFLDNPFIILLIFHTRAVAVYFGEVKEVITSFTMSVGSLDLLNRNRVIPFPAKGKPGTPQDLPGREIPCGD